MSANPKDNLALQKLQEFLPGAIEDAHCFRGETTLFIRLSLLRRTWEFLRDEPHLEFRFLVDVTALDLYPREPRFEVVYHLLSLANGQRLRLKVRLPSENPVLPSAVPVWPSANAFEREVFDLFGITFEGHPFLERILMPDNWEGHPLRKDYPTEGYR